MFLRCARIPNHTLQRRLVPVHSPYLPGHPQAMLTEIYIKALPVDEELADHIWDAWNAGEIDDFKACLVWWWIVVSGTHKFWCWRTIENQESPYGYA